MSVKLTWSERSAPRAQQRHRHRREDVPRSPAAAAPCQPGSSSPIASRGQGPDYEADSCGSPSGSPSPQEGGISEIAAGASSMELSLEAQVRCEVARYALDEGRLRMLMEEQGASFSATVASVVVDKLCGFIAAAKGMARRTTRCKRLQRSRLRRHAPTSGLSTKTWRNRCRGGSGSGFE